MIKFLRPLLLNLSLRMRLNSLSNQRPLPPPPQLLLILFPTFCMSHQRRRKRWFLCMRMKYLRITTMNLTKLLSQVLPTFTYIPNCQALSSGCHTDLTWKKSNQVNFEIPRPKWISKWWTRLNFKWGCKRRAFMY